MQLTRILFPLGSSDDTTVSAKEQGEGFSQKAAMIIEAVLPALREAVMAAAQFRRGRLR